MDLSVVETLTCGRCGTDWERVRCTGPKPSTCPECPRIPQQRQPRPLPALNSTTAAYRVAAAAVDYRLAIELATSALRLGRPTDALAHLEAVAAPARLNPVRVNNHSHQPGGGAA